MGASDVVSVCGCWLPWALVTVGVATPCRFLMGCIGIRLMNKVGVAALCRCDCCGLWVSVMWSVWVTVGIAAPCLFLMASGMHLTSKVGVATLCGCVCCGLWVPLMSSVCGCGLPWALQPFAGVYCLRGCVCG